MLVMSGIFLLAFFWKLPYLGVRDLSMDEPFTLYHSQKSIGDILKLSKEGEPNPPLFMILVHYWSLIVGYKEEYLRILPLVFNACTASFVYIIGKRFFSIWAGLLAVGLFLFSNYYFYYATELRPYGLVSLATAGALYYFLSLEKENTAKAFVGLVICNVVLVYTHYFGWFVVGVEGFCALIYLKDRPLFKRYVGAIILSGLCFLPMIGVFVEQFNHSSSGTWVAKPKLSDLRLQLHAFVNSGMVYRLMEFLIPIGLVAALIIGKLFQTPKKYLVVLLWWMVPFFLMFVLSEQIPMFLDRYVLFCSVGLFLFIGSFIERFAHFWWVQMVLSALLVFHMSTRFNSETFYIKRDIKSAVEEVERLTDENSIVVIYPEWAKLNFSYHYSLEAFKNVSNLDYELHSQHVFPVWNTGQALHIADSLKAEEIIFFTNGGLGSPEMNDFYLGLKNKCSLLSTENFQENLTVAKFKN